MNFPIYDISEYSWKKYRVKEHNILYENPYTGILPSNKDKFVELIREFKYVDPDGVLFKVIGFKLHTKGRLARLLSLTSKIELELVRTDEQYTIDEFKKLIIKRAKETQNEKLKKIAPNANSFKDILHQIT